MRREERQQYYDQLHRQSIAGSTPEGSACSRVPQESLSPDRQSETAASQTLRRVTLNPPPSFRNPEKVTGYPPVDLLESSSSSFSGPQSDWDETAFHQEDWIFDDYDNDPPDCSVELPFWTEAVGEEGTLEEPAMEATAGASHVPEASWDPPPPSCSPSPYLPPDVHFSPCSSPPSLSSSSPLPRSTSSVASSVSELSSSGDGAASDVRRSQDCLPSSPRERDRADASSGAADAIVPVVVALVRSAPALSVDGITDQVAATSSAMSRAEIRRLVTAAVSSEQLLASSLQLLVGAALAVDPSGRSAFVHATTELLRVLSRPG
jgi:hypothetical protein